MLVLYLAGPIFTRAEQTWLKDLKFAIQESAKERNISMEIFWPFEFTPKKENEQLTCDYRDSILEICREGLNRADIMIAILDGPQVDDGTAWEVGYFFCRNSPRARIFGLRTDFRNAGDTSFSRVNSLIDRACLEISGNIEDFINKLLKNAESMEKSSSK